MRDARGAGAQRGARVVGSVTLIGSETHLPYERPPLSKDAILGAAPAPKTIAGAEGLGEAGSTSGPASPSRRSTGRAGGRWCSMVARGSPTTGCCSRPGRGRGGCRSPGRGGRGWRRCGPLTMRRGSGGARAGGRGWR